MITTGVRLGFPLGWGGLGVFGGEVGAFAGGCCIMLYGALSSGIVRWGGGAFWWLSHRAVPSILPSGICPIINSALLPKACPECFL